MNKKIKDVSINELEKQMNNLSNSVKLYKDIETEWKLRKQYEKVETLKENINKCFYREYYEHGEHKEIYVLIKDIHFDISINYIVDVIKVSHEYGRLLIDRFAYQFNLYYSPDFIDKHTKIEKKVFIKKYNEVIKIIKNNLEKSI